ncbi:hypothetical protein HIM_07774 [Hirsutella minnesotensis 3608]|uniref:Ubiquitin-like 1-activating enzyme E1A n=1 Tax=Hirsutella minnesotensis 3608 TaxID=1043627 RepID=A0A0F7ZMY9_9HYPO|nr:hypothetical protein HIM_07774 [Hirsutella minnesotensis 3608]
MEQQHQQNGAHPSQPLNTQGLNSEAGSMPLFDPTFLSQTDPSQMPNLANMQDLMPGAPGQSIPIGDPNMLLPTMMANGAMPAPMQQNDKTVSADEIALYDRQIRLWGMAAQAKIQGANILLITMRALGNEIAKNLVLAGIGSLTILDGSPVTEADFGAQFFLAEGGESLIGQNRAQAASAEVRKLNPRVQVFVDSDSVVGKGPSYFAGFDVVIATDLDPDTFNIINTATRINGKAFYAAGSHGMFGFIFADLIEHDYIIEREAGNVSTKPRQETRTRAIVDVKTKRDGPKTAESVTKRELYSTWFLASDVGVLPDEYVKSKRRLKKVSPALSCLRALWEFKQLKGGALPSNRDDLKLFTQIATQKHKALGLPGETLKPEFLRSFLQNLGSEFAPVTAILGGQLAQDVINVLGQTQQPIQNMVIFDGERTEAAMYPLHPEGELGAQLLSLGGGTAMPSNGAPMLMDAGLGGMLGLPGMSVDAGTASGMPQLSGAMGLSTGDAPMMNAGGLETLSNGSTAAQDTINVSQEAPGGTTPLHAGAGP